MTNTREGKKCQGSVFLYKLVGGFIPGCLAGDLGLS